QESASSWEDALRVASKPLLKNKSITENYVEAMVKSNSDPYIIISPNTAIPHALPDDGVKQLSMSLLQLKEGVKFADTLINVVIVIAAVDKEQHIRTLTQHTELAAKHRQRNSIIKAQSAKDIYRIINLFESRIERSEAKLMQN